LCQNVTYAVLKFQKKMVSTAMTVENSHAIHAAMEIFVTSAYEMKYFSLTFYKLLTHHKVRRKKH